MKLSLFALSAFCSIATSRNGLSANAALADDDVPPPPPPKYPVVGDDENVVYEDCEDSIWFQESHHALTILEPIGDGSQYTCNESLIQIYMKDKVLGSIMGTEAWPAFLELVFAWKLDKVLVREILRREGEERSDDPVAFGDFQQGKEFLKTLDDLKTFWAIPETDQVFVRSFNTNIFTDSHALKAAYDKAFPSWEVSQVDTAVRRVQELIAMYPQIGVSFPFWTFNAFAWAPRSNKSFGYGIAIGDGLLGFFEWLGLSDTAPEYLLAHEFAHHLQRFTDVLPAEKTPESTRYMELMADSLAGYFMHHPRGASRQTWKLSQVIEAAFAGGDCDFFSDGHHGTPNQRLASTEFAVQLIDNEVTTNGGKGRIKSVQDFMDIFYSAFDQLTHSDIVN